MILRTQPEAKQGASSSRPWELPTSEMGAREVALRAERGGGTEAGK
jgi:hypothetical protein